ncbi:MAG: SHOCT domain-containing protein [Deltaproteobacteria bacterium]|nr:SHOCT domain-containing protein [Deltaproteobacteria bacterium]
MGGDCGMGWGGGLSMLLFWGIAILVVVLLVRLVLGRSRTGAGSMREESALDLLKKRYARGEINREEYARMRQDLE